MVGVRFFNKLTTPHKLHGFKSFVYTGHIFIGRGGSGEMLMNDFTGREFIAEVEMHAIMWCPGAWKDFYRFQKCF